MRKQSLPLIKTNLYLQDSLECDVWLNRSVVSSSAIEGVRTAALRALGVKEKSKKTRVSHSASRSSRSHQ